MAGGVPGVLDVPPGARALVVVLHGPEPALGTAALLRAQLATLLVGPGMGEAVSEADVLGALCWIATEATAEELPPALAALPVGCLAAGAGARTALRAAAARPDRIAAVVAVVDDPQAAAPAAPPVPTLLLARGDDVEARARDWLVGHLGAAQPE